MSLLPFLMARLLSRMSAAYQILRRLGPLSDGNRIRCCFYAFDILHLDGEDLRDQPLLDRRTKLKGLLGRDRTSPLQFSDEFTGDSAAFFRACAKHGLEGVVSKLASSRYRSGRSKTWLKSKCFTESDLVIIGTDRDRKTGATRALLAMRPQPHLCGRGFHRIAWRCVA